MKLKIINFNELAAEKGYSGKSLLLKLGAGKNAYECFENGCGIGYDLAKDLYNFFGEAKFIKIINFEGDTLNGFKSKYVKVGNKLY